MVRASPNHNLINYQTECNRDFKETAQIQPKPKSHQFSIPYLAERGGAKRRRARQPGVIGISRKLVRVSPSQNLINFQLECNMISRKLIRASPSQNLIDFHLELN